MKILLLGSSGLLGTNIERVCNNLWATSKSVDCIGLDHNDIEITDYQAIVKALEIVEPDVVINTVAMVGINLCELHPAEATETNALAVLDLAKQCGMKDITLVQVSTDKVFDGEKREPHHEKDLPRPTGVYALTKYLGEHFASVYCPKHYIIRVPTMFGKRRNQKPGFSDKVIKWLRAGETLRIAYDKIDSPTYALDIAERLISAVLLGKNPYGVYHLANSGYVSFYEFVLKVANLLKIKATITPVKDEVFNTNMITAPLRSALCSIKLAPMRKWEEALKEYIENDVE